MNAMPRAEPLRGMLHPKTNFSKKKKKQLPLERFSIGLINLYSFGPLLSQRGQWLGCSLAPLTGTSITVSNFQFPVGHRASALCVSKATLWA